MRSPLITMTAVTGKPTESDIFDYLKGLCQNGIDEVLIYPRSGCEIEYLSNEWFDTVGYFIKGALALDMCLWLYDDFNWPSGDAGGRVTAIPEYRLMSIVTRGEDRGKISCKSRHNSGLFGEKYFPNLLSPQAVDYFIKCTHEEYFARFGKYFGTVIKGIFTDEPSVGYCCEHNSVAYYDGIEQDYYTLCQRDFARDMESEDPSFYLNVTRVISNQFSRCYILRLRDWCQSHGILMTGHFLSDCFVQSAVKHGGDFLKNLSSLSLPGIDDIDTSFESIHQAELFGVAEYVGRKNGAMAELFALGPCDMTYAKRKCMLYFAACHKIDHYFLAISHLDMRGNLKVTDYFNNFNVAQPDFGGMKILSEEAKKAQKYAHCDYTPDVYVRYPFSICAERITENLELECFYQLLNKLTYSQIQWKLINEGEDTVKAPIIELTRNLDFTLDGKPVKIDEICEIINTSPVVTDINGKLTNGIFVRKFNDGQDVILNLFAKPDYYLINGHKVYIEKHAVILDPKEDSLNREALSCELNVNYCNPNIIRAMYLNEATNTYIHCAQDTDVIFAVRNGEKALLDGKELVCSNGCEQLPKGMQNLYTASKPITLKKGTSMLSSQNDIKYMPSVFIIGDFCADATHKEACEISLLPQKNVHSPSQKLCDYGKIEFSTKVYLPENVTAVELAGTELYTQVYADGMLLGSAICAPYIYEIGKDFRGKEIEFKIVQYSSIAPILGDVDHWDKNIIHTQWRGTPSTAKTHFGFDQVNLIFST